MELGSRIGFVVATLGERNAMLARLIKSLESVADQIVIVAPKQVLPKLRNDFEGRGITFLLDRGMGLATAINDGFKELREEIVYANWIGDDDGILPEGWESLPRELDVCRAVAAFGNCEYRTANGAKLGESKAGKLATQILHWGPDLIPQPASLFRLEALREVGFLREDFALAFDYELFLRLMEIGEIRYVPRVVAYFTWHAGSLSASQRLNSAKEAYRVRQLHSRGVHRMIVVFSAPLVVAATVIAGTVLNLAANRRRGSAQ